MSDHLSATKASNWNNHSLSPICINIIKISNYTLLLFSFLLNNQDLTGICLWYGLFYLILMIDTAKQNYQFAQFDKLSQFLLTKIMPEHGLTLAHELLGNKASRMIPQKLDYQSLIIKQQNTINCLKEQNKRLWQYILYITDQDNISQNTSITDKHEPPSQTSSSDAQETIPSTSQKIQETAPLLKLPQDNKIKSLQNLLAEVMKVAEAKDVSQIRSKLKELEKKAKRKVEPVFIERIKEKQVPITIQKKCPKCQPIEEADKIKLPQDVCQSKEKSETSQSKCQQAEKNRYKEKQVPKKKTQKLEFREKKPEQIVDFKIMDKSMSKSQYLNTEEDNMDHKMIKKERTQNATFASQILNKNIIIPSNDKNQGNKNEQGLKSLVMTTCSSSATEVVPGAARSFFNSRQKNVNQDLMLKDEPPIKKQHSPSYKQIKETCKTDKKTDRFQSPRPCNTKFDGHKSPQRNNYGSQKRYMEK